ncbi:MAG: L,D-transpeptidase family protein [Candidatus Gorgyraea atricola]|nr:L,D-transpeptidase family protein [Candidatus Gorgyraea atricola]
MNSKLVGAGIGLALILVLIIIVFSPKNQAKIEGLSDFRSVRELISKDDLDEAEKKIAELTDKDPDSAEAGRVYFDLAKSYEKKEEIVKARDAYQMILSKYQNVDNILQIQEKLGALNIEILFSPIITDMDLLYQVEPGDSLTKIAKKFKTTIELIKASNSLESNTIMANSRLKVSTARYKILIDKSQNLLTIFSGDEDTVKVYPVSTGKNGSTPVGTFTIINRMEDPVWYKEGAMVPAESPENILGSRWLGLSEKGYGIHGTIDPDSVGQQATQGCVRMFNADVEELYAIIPVGTQVTTVE